MRPHVSLVPMMIFLACLALVPRSEHACPSIVGAVGSAATARANAMTVERERGHGLLAQSLSTSALRSRSGSGRIVAGAGASAGDPHFPVPDLEAEFTTFNANYSNQMQDVISQLRGYYGEFLKLTAQYPHANTTCANQMLVECKLQVATTANFSLAYKILKKLDAFLQTPPMTWPDDKQNPVDGGWGLCYESWQLRVDASYDKITDLADAGKTPAIPMTIFDRVNSPEKLLGWLRSKITSNIPKDGTDQSIEANDGNADLLRLISKKLPANYPWEPTLWPALVNFTLNEWRNDTTGYWGPTYILRDGVTAVQVPDISTTFHIAKYYTERDINIHGWSQLGQTTVDLIYIPFPWGQFTKAGIPFNHNLMDTATLFSLAWPEANNQTRAQMKAQSMEWLNFTLNLLQPDGSWPTTAYDDTAETAQYFGVTSLHNYGFFDSKYCYWSQDDPSQCLLNRTVSQQRVIFDKIASHIFYELSNQHGGGTYYISALSTIGLDIPVHLRG